MQRGIPVNDPDALTNFAQGLSIQPGEAGPGAREATTVIIDGDDATPHLREPEVDRNVSLVSRVPGVRAALMRVQRELAAVGHVVMAGRDIGSVVLPEADLKIYLDAPLRVRAKRRLDQLASSGRQEDLESIMEDLARRDRIDSSRDASPLTAASDAVIINTDGLSLEEVVRRIAALARG